MKLQISSPPSGSIPRYRSDIYFLKQNPPIPTRIIINIITTLFQSIHPPTLPNINHSTFPLLLLRLLTLLPTLHAPALLGGLGPLYSSLGMVRP